MTSDPVNYFYTLNIYNCRAGVVNDINLHYIFLERLADKIGMLHMLLPQRGSQGGKSRVFNKNIFD